MNNRTLLALITLLSGLFVFQAVNKGAHKSNAAVKVRASQQHTGALPKADLAIVETPLIHASFRPLNFALLRGGFSSVNEFFERVHDDPVLHAFYGDCADRNASMHALPEDITAFSTFRKGDKIKWAQKPLLIKKGEYVMTFCGKTVLARCGNLISVSPMQPSEDVLPAVLEAPSEPVEAPLTLVAAAGPAPATPAVASVVTPSVVPAVAAGHHGFFFIPPFYVPPGGSHSSPPVIPPPSSVIPPPTTVVPPPITTAPPPPPSGPPPPPPGHISGDEFSGHQAFITLLIGLFVIGLLKLTTR